MKALALLVLCSCNQIFGLQKTNPAYYDAPFTCPMPGGTPSFASLVHQAVAQKCLGYTISTARGVGMAACYDSTLRPRPSEGPIDGMLATVTGLDDTIAAPTYMRLSPEGDEAIGAYIDAGTCTFRTYQRQSDGSWLRGPDLGTSTNNLEYSTPTRRPNRHMLETGTGDKALHELVETAPGTWSEIASYSESELGMLGPSYPELSPDGLRLVLSGTSSSGMTLVVFYSDRPTIADRFRTTVPLAGVPPASDPFLTEDCARVYFSSLGTIAYVQQQ